MTTDSALSLVEHADISTEEYTGPERRKEPRERSSKLFLAIEALACRMDDFGGKLDRFSKAFPNDDPDGHRRFHEAEIRRAEARAEFWEKMRFEVVKWGLFGFLGWAAYQLWIAFIHGPQK